MEKYIVLSELLDYLDTLDREEMQRHNDLLHQTAEDAEEVAGIAQELAMAEGGLLDIEEVRQWAQGNARLN